MACHGHGSPGWNWCALPAEPAGRVLYVGPVEPGLTAKRMIGVLMVFLGGGAGAAARYGVSIAALSLFGPALPLGTLAVNVAGSFAMGLVWAYVSAHLETLPVEVRLMLATGFLGGFTTFSAFSLEAVSLWERGDGLLAAGYVLLSVVLSLAALALGLWLMRSFNGGTI